MCRKHVRSLKSLATTDTPTLSGTTSLSTAFLFPRVNRTRHYVRNVYVRVLGTVRGSTNVKHTMLSSPRVSYRSITYLIMVKRVCGTSTRGAVHARYDRIRSLRAHLTDSYWRTTRAFRSENRQLPYRVSLVPVPSPACYRGDVFRARVCRSARENGLNVSFVRTARSVRNYAARYGCNGFVPLATTDGNGMFFEKRLESRGVRIFKRVSTVFRVSSKSCDKSAKPGESENERKWYSNRFCNIRASPFTRREFVVVSVPFSYIIYTDLERLPRAYRSRERLHGTRTGRTYRAFR